MSATETKERLLAKARGEAIIEYYLRVLDFKGNVLDKALIQHGEDLDLIVLNNKEELEDYETENLHR